MIHCHIKMINRASFSRATIFLVFLLSFLSCRHDRVTTATQPPHGTLPGTVNHRSNLPFDSGMVKIFYDSFPLLGSFRPDVEEVYRRHDFTEIWHDGQGLLESAMTLFNRTRDLCSEGVPSQFPYQAEADRIFLNELENRLDPAGTDLMITNLYLFYAEKVIRGLPDTTSKALGWLLPRKTIAYTDLLDTLLTRPEAMADDDSLMIGQYYRMRDALQRYREIEKKGLWPVADTIRKLVVNMERCRWIPPEYARAKEYVVVNIPAFMLTYVRDGRIELRSPVIVGKKVTKTVIFSGMMSHIVFSPYWNVPQSIINKEIRPGIARDPGYLEKHNMEWNNGQVRQRPGKNNSLGRVKFIFPNSNDIYLHDTPAKGLFEKDNRAFSHGCIRVGKPRDLAQALLQDDPNWTPAKIDRAMNAGKETVAVLKEKIPVHIGYFTAWVDDQGILRIFNDIYERDDRLATLLYESGTPVSP